ncbi:sulfatase family protein [Paenibacillus glycanilyticus]|uniref:Choline-sulfatase n=1 Tax=Paenibacillus glycanilyticus TaxID=126569 RepID=A0ABQ6GFC4_9BACL|nr:sulfatase-like hydrolase/transferase [Paenibacillus glycanilyticus]GLX67747.1 choline-sulfatase [Paenibacillus glycanilyticus]
MTTSSPHVIFITMDELRKDALSCYGNKAIETPHLDKLASESIRFDKAYAVSPWCLPSRSAILTGQYPHQSGAYSNFRKCELSADIPNLFGTFREGGYRTAVFGKCHFSPVPYSQTRPEVTLAYEAFRDYYLKLGIDHLDLQDDKQVSVWFYDDYAKELDAAGYLEAYRQEVWNEKANGKVFKFPGPPEWHPDSWVGRKAVQYIESYAEDQPMFAWVSFSGPHFPFDAPEPYLERVDMSKDTPRKWKADEFDDKRRIHHGSYHGPGGIEGSGAAADQACKNHSETYWQNLRRSYYANISQIDDAIGMILESVYRKFGDNALIIVTADHGEMLGNHGLWGKNNCAYEDVLNVPLLVQYPGERQGSATDAKVMLTDIMATCIKTAGLMEKKTVGRDFRESIHAGGYPYVFAEGEGFACVSDGRHKYVHVQKNGQQTCEMFDLAHDPYEYANIVDDPAYSAILSDLRGQLLNLYMNKVLA